jgi:hypothetical protein
MTKTRDLLFRKRGRPKRAPQAADRLVRREIERECASGHVPIRVELRN